ncbi:MAG: PDZ domain-containing protein [Myxococcales bacterium]|nr:PDZ domain-containing protein [Myxococcales bacterium]
MRRWQALVAIAAGVGLLVGLAWGGLLRSEAPVATAPRPDAGAPFAADEGLRAEIAGLREALAAERDERVALATEVAGLREELEGMTGLAPDSEAPPEAPDAPDTIASAALQAHGSIGVFEETKLVEAGIPRDEVEALRERYDRSRMDELYMNDQAAREGWLRTPRHLAELQDLRGGLRDEIGDDDYDLLLYAVGKSNRVIVSDVLRESPAMEAGFLSGDVLLRYDGRRIFNVFELKQATTEGKPGATVAVEIRRGDQSLRFYLPRGPLGITMRSDVQPPQAAR